MELFEQFPQYFTSSWAQFTAATSMGIVLGLLVAAFLKLIESRSSRAVIQNAAARIRSIAFVMGVGIGLRFGLNAFDIDPTILAQLQNGFTLALFLLATWALNHVYDSIHEAVLLPWGQRKDNATLVQVGGTIAHVLIWLLGIVSGLDSSGYNVTSVLAGLGLGGLAFALAAQDTVSNIFGGVVILTQNPFHVGDNIEVNGTRGWVNKIGIRSTVIDTWLGHKVTLPNKVFTDSPVTNIDTRTMYWEEMPLKLRHDCTVEQIERSVEITKQLILDNKNVSDSAWVGVSNIGEGFIEIEIWYGTLVWKPEQSDEFPDFYSKKLGVKHSILLALLRALEQEGIPLATPMQSLFVHKEQDFPQSRFSTMNRPTSIAV